MSNKENNNQNIDLKEVNTSKNNEETKENHIIEVTPSDKETN